MQLIQRNKDSAYLQYDKYVDYDNPIVAAKAKELAEGCKSSDEIIQACYYFVRDEISHTYDSNFTIITISASDVLKARTGISYSKANLLAQMGHEIDSAAGEYVFNDLIAVPLPSTMRILENSTNFLKMYFNDMPDYDA